MPRTGPCSLPDNNAVDISGIVVIALLVGAIGVIAFLYRRGSFRAGMKALGASLDVEGRGAVGDEARTAVSDPAKSAEAAAKAAETSGTSKRSIQVGRDAQGAFVTGPHLAGS